MYLSHLTHSFTLSFLLFSKLLSIKSISDSRNSKWINYNRIRCCNQSKMKREKNHCIENVFAKIHTQIRTKKFMAHLTGRHQVKRKEKDRERLRKVEHMIKFRALEIWDIQHKSCHTTVVLKKLLSLSLFFWSLK